MFYRKRVHALARMSVAVVAGVALGACGASTDPARTARAPIVQGQAHGANSSSVLPEVVVSAPRLGSPRVAEETSSRPPAKRRGG